MVLEESDIRRALLVPSGALARYVDRIFTLVSEPGGRRVVNLPQGNADIVFRGFRDARSGLAFGDIHAVGAQTQAFEIPDPELLVTLIVRFRPGGAFPFLHVPMSELTDSVVPLHELWGATGSELLNQLMEMPSTSTWMKLVERALHAQLERANPDASAVTTAALVTEAVARSSVLPSVRTMAEELGMSERHLHRQFQKAIGLAPKLYTRITRFERAISCMARRPGAPGWAEMSLEAGYYDQAHLIRDCRKLTGKSPAQFLSAWKRGRQDELR